MTLFVLAYLAGLLTIASPCILPILPFVLARADRPFRRGGLPLLAGLVLTFAAVTTLAAVAGGWAVEVNRHGRTAALAVMTLFGLAMLFPALADRMMAPLVSIGSRLADWAGPRTNNDATVGASVLLGVATGLVWAPCAGPVMGLILTGAALRGPGVETSLLLLTYGLGAATSLAAGLLFGRRLLALVSRSWRWDEWYAPGSRRSRRGRRCGRLARRRHRPAHAPVFNRHRQARARSDRRLAPRRAVPATARAAESAAPPSALPSPLNSLFEMRQWLNTPPRPEDLRGKVVLVNFWTYSCINCLRTLPHVRAWAEKYRDRGLVVIGVHTPEFAFEKEAANVRKASAALGVSYPVVIDNDFAIWRAFDNQAWPAIYFIGADGRVRHHTLGEGGYDQSERLIQQLLSETNGAPVTKDMAAIRAEGRAGRGGRRQSAFIRNLHRLPAGREFRVSRRHQAGCPQPLSRHAGAAAQPMESRRAIGRSEASSPRSTGRPAASSIVFTPAIFISSWALPRKAGRFASGSKSMARLRVPTMVPMSMRQGGAPCGTSGSINWSGKPGKLPSAPSRSNSSIPASAPMSSRSDRSNATARRPLP